MTRTGKEKLCQLTRTRSETWFANFRYMDWRGEPKKKSKRGFRTKRETQIWERDFKKRMSRGTSIEFLLACKI